MTPTVLPPFTTAPVRFPFRNLAAQAGRASLGGAREVALACLMAARLASAMLSPAALPLVARTARKAAVRRWFAGLTLPTALHAALGRVAEASARDDPQSVAAALSAVLAAARRQLDTGSVSDIERLIHQLNETKPFPARLA